MYSCNYYHLCKGTQRHSIEIGIQRTCIHTYICNHLGMDSTNKPPNYQIQYIHAHRYIPTYLSTHPSKFLVQSHLESELAACYFSVSL